ncbi:hypothetical protein OS493_002212 [Desmophyllum pertusum]|uniref:ABC transmembrane type-1 domain-containing protein n=1 Tax=Desmophyllum pertusum TaxID=174260 RepID=A0A9W9Z7P5_9CNID|nr:hypothetical protein OS493_002212 [Desmophyllum pertusum]
MHPDESHRYLIYGCSVLMMVTVIVRSLAMHQYDYRSLYLGMQLRSALKGIVYTKILLLGQYTLRNFTTGHLVDLVSNDVQRMDRVAVEFFRLWLSAFDLLCLTPLMWIVIGWQAVVGLICLLLFSPISAYLSYLSGGFRVMTAEVTDRRLNLLNEVISGIRSVKTNTMEWFYGDKITQIRR